MFQKAFNSINEFIVADRFIFDIEALQAVIDSNDFAIISYVNPHNISKINLCKILETENWYIVTDGYFIAKCLGVIFNKEIHPLNIDVSSPPLFKVLDNCPPGGSVKFIGGTCVQAKYFEEHFSYRKFDIKCFDGYDDNSLNVFIESEAAFKFLSLGSPLQEDCALKNLEMLKKTSQCIIMCGGFVGQFSNGQGKVYPSWAIRTNTRFIYRLFTERATFMRIVKTYIPFFMYVFAELIIRSVKKK